MSENTPENSERRPAPGTTLSVTIKQIAGADGNVSTHMAGTHGDPLVNLLLLSAGQQILLDMMVKEQMNSGGEKKPEAPRLWVPGAPLGN